MTLPVMQPALVIFPYVAFTSSADRDAGDLELVAKVVSSAPDRLVLDVLNGEYRLTIGADGKTHEPDHPDLDGRQAYLQWQGDGGQDEFATAITDFLMDDIRAEIAKDRRGPLHAAALASHARLGQLPLRSAAKRLEILGDGRLMRYLAAEYPGIALLGQP